MTKLLNCETSLRSLFASLKVAKLFKPFSNSRRGFTLIELLVVITIIGILITLVTVAVVPVQRRSRDAKRKAEVNSFLSGINLFKADFKIYPNPTFYLGSYGTVANGGINSNYALADDIEDCNIASAGATSTFLNLNGQTIMTLGKPTAAEMNAMPLLMKPGFESVNNFLICMRYMDRVLVDPKPMSSGNEDKYQYRVSYDYGDVVVTSKLENSATDSDASFLFNQTSTLKRYYRGSGSVVRHLDDDSDTDSSTLGAINLNFFGSLSAGFVTDGKYLYQCKRKSADDQVITPDNKISYEPIISSTSSYIANSACKDAAVDLDVIPAY
ncbi:MAG: prepilin-type N-terminal cleavage/methylation domain-containing protein [bacterium]|nr:prepilin-type N-terminal cleavage/methylation domain-containing protein [bacterium]